MKSVVCAIIKNEQRFIREWVEHYLNIGFKEIYVFEDYGSESHIEQLHNYIDGGQVILNNLEESHYVPRDRGTIVQSKLYSKFLNWCKQEGSADWIGFFDTDEFLMFEDGWDLARLEEEFKDYGGVLLSWRVYGANGHLKRPEGRVMDNYTTFMPDGFLIDKQTQWNVKSLVNVRNCTGKKHIHVFNGCPMTDYSTIDNALFLTYTKAWLNHYFTKSWEDYLDRIFARGNMQNNYRCLDKFFDVNPDMLHRKKQMVEGQRYRHAASTMWISRDLKIISGGNEQELKTIRKKYIQTV